MKRRKLILLHRKLTPTWLGIVSRSIVLNSNWVVLVKKIARVKLLFSMNLVSLGYARPLPFPSALAGSGDEGLTSCKILINKIANFSF